MAWLLRRGEVLASIDVVTSRRAALRSVAADGSSGAPAAIASGTVAVHGLGGRRGADVAYLDADLVVLRGSHLGRGGADRARARARSVLVAEAGSFDRWGLRAGDVLELKE